MSTSRPMEQFRPSGPSTAVVVATSAEPSAGTNGANDRRYFFRHRVPLLEMPEGEQWHVGLGRVSFYTPANQQVFINASVVAPSRVGAQTVNQLFHIPLTQTAAGLFQLEVTNIMFRPVSVTALTEIEVSLTDQQGNILPDPPDPVNDPETYVTLFFQRER